MPALDSIHSTTVRSVKGAKFRIMRTVEVDAYEEGGPAVELASALATRRPSTAILSKLLAKKPAGDNFGGTARKAAKLSIAAAAVEPFSDVRSLIQTLVADDKMVKKTADPGDGHLEPCRSREAECARQSIPVCRQPRG